MCLYVRVKEGYGAKEGIEPSIAEKDIDVWKVMRYNPVSCKYISPFIELSVEFDEEGKCVMRPMIDGLMQGVARFEGIEEHRFFSSREGVGYIDGTPDGQPAMMEVYEGIHAYTTDSAAQVAKKRVSYFACKEGERCVVLHGKIPKGAAYYVSNTLLGCQEIVADEMILYKLSLSNVPEIFGEE